MTPSPSVDPAALLRARLDEDEEAAKAATPGPWRVVNVTDYRSATVDGPDTLQDGGYDDAIKARRQIMRPQTVIPQDVDYGPTVDLADAKHIARHDPARVLADIAAKREVIRLYEDTLETIEMLKAHGQKTAAHEVAAESYLNVIRAHVAAYSGQVDRRHELRA